MQALLTLLAALPLLEMFVLFKLGRAFGAALPVGAIIVSGLIGAWLARREGLRYLDAWRRAIVAGTAPERGVLSGMLVLLGCVLLILPGVISDVLGLVLLVAPTRALVARAVAARVERAIQRGAFQATAVDLAGTPARRSVIDVEAEVIEPRPKGGSIVRGGREQG